MNHVLGTARSVYDGPYHLFPEWRLVWQPERAAILGGDGVSACGNIDAKDAPSPGRGRRRRLCGRCAQVQQRCRRLGLPLMRGTWELRHDELLRVRKVTLEQAA